MPATRPDPATADLRVQVSDLYLAAYLATDPESTLLEIRFDSRGKASFLFSGPRVIQSRKAYAEGNATVNPLLFKSAYNRLRDSVAEVKTHPLVGG
jgi:hypothetical protein